LGRLSGRATPSLRDDPTATHYVTNRQGIHLTEAKRCSEQANHLWLSLNWQSPWILSMAAGIRLVSL